MTYDEGRKIIADMLAEKKLINWSSQDLGQYLTEKYGCVKFSPYNTVQLDGWFSISVLEAILIALYNERGAMRG